MAAAHRGGAGWRIVTAEGRGEASAKARAPRERSWLEVRWRRLRNAPPPVARAVAANVAVAAALGVLLLAYELAIRGGAPSGGGLRTAVIAGYVLAVLGAGSLLTYLWAPLPSGASGKRRRTAWSAALGALTALPVAYIGLVVVYQLLAPALGAG
jgi:hypothetical protein